MGVTVLAVVCTLLAVAVLWLWLALGLVARQGAAERQALALTHAQLYGELAGRLVEVEQQLALLGVSVPGKPS